MGVVYEARQVRLNRLVALKMIRSGALATEEDVRRFRNEAEAVALLDHPRIVTVHEVGEDAGWHYLSMKLFRGGTLAERVARFQADPRAAATLMIEVARAVQYAHEKGILHRDLKPANILIDENGQPHVSDFGLAKRLESGSDLTGTGAILGTPAYMAPEQAAGDKGRVTALSDVYGLGAVLYALLTGRAPFVGASPLEVLEKVRTQEPDPPSRIQPRVPRDLEVICLKALDKDPRRRYGSAGALAADLGRWLVGAPIEARSVGPVRRAWMWSRRNWNVAATMAGLSLLTGVSTAQWLRAEGSLRELGRRATADDIDRAIQWCESGEVARGLSLFAEALDRVPRDSDDLRQALRANIAAWMPHATRLRGVLAHDDQVYLAKYSPYGETILTLGSSRETADRSLPAGDGARLWDRRSLEPIGDLLSHGAGIYDAAFHPDGRSFVTCGANGLVRFWRVPEGTPGRQPLEQPGVLFSVAYSPDGRGLLVGGSDGTACLWDTQTGELKQRLSGYRSGVFQVGFLGEGRLGLTACRDRKLRLWDIHSGRMLDEGAAVFRRQSELRPGSQFATTSSGTVYLTNRVAGDSGESGAQMWDAATREPAGKPLRHEDPVNAVALSDDGTVAATASDDRTARLWDTRTGEVLRILRHRDRVMAVVLSADGSVVLTGTEGGTAQLWSVVDGVPIGDSMRHPWPALNAAIHESGREVLIAADQGMARVWAIPDPAGRRGAPVSDASLDVDPPNIAYSPDGKRMLVGYFDAPSKVRDAQTQFETGISLPHEHAVRAVDWSPDGQWLATAGSDGVIRIWSADSGRLIRQFEAHQGTIRSVTFSREGQFLLSGGEDRQARLWHAAWGQPVGPALRHDAPVNAVAFERERTAILTRTDDQVARRWPLPTAEPAPDEAYRLWVSLATGTRRAEGGTLEALEASEWHELRSRLRAAGGAPDGGHDSEAIP
jgi:WD40 repeat protein